MGFTPTVLDPSCYQKRNGAKYIIALIYVDDILLFANNRPDIVKFGAGLGNASP